jgi:hypothetical protein
MVENGEIAIGCNTGEEKDGLRMRAGGGGLYRWLHDTELYYITIWIVIFMVRFAKVSSGVTKIYNKLNTFLFCCSPSVT